MVEFKDYKELNKTFDYDKAKATLLAEAMTERLDLLKRIKYLEQIAADNADLTKFLWTTAEGKTLAIHDIANDHLRNILIHIVERGGTISAEIKAEAISRGLSIPEINTDRLYSRRRHLIEAEIADDEDDDEPIDLSEIPF